MAASATLCLVIICALALSNAQLFPSSTFLQGTGSDSAYYLNANNPYMGTTPQYYTISPVSGKTNTYQIYQGVYYLGANGFTTDSTDVGTQFQLFYVAENTPQITVFNPSLNSYNGNGWMCVSDTPYGPYLPWFCTSPYTFQIVSASTPYNISSFNAQSSNTGNGSVSSVFPSQASTGNYWDAAVPGQYSAPNWIVFDLLLDTWVVSSFAYQSIGDTTHDPASFKLQVGLSPTGPWNKVQTFSPTTGTSALQSFTLSTATTGRYWRWYIITTGSSIYETMARNVNFFASPSKSPVPLNVFTVSDFSVQYTDNNVNGYATNLLPVNNPTNSCVIIWNAGEPGSPLYDNPWIIFDLGAGGASLQVTQFAFKGVGDSVHDPIQFILASSFSSEGPWTNAGTFYPTSGNANLQKFTLSTPTAAQFWRFLVIYTSTGYQPYICYVNFYHN